MSRVVAYRIGIAILVVLAFWLLWSLAYEIVVALRWAPERFPSEGSSRWRCSPCRMPTARRISS